MTSKATVREGVTEKQSPGVPILVHINAPTASTHQAQRYLQRPRVVRDLDRLVGVALVVKIPHTLQVKAEVT